MQAENEGVKITNTSSPVLEVEGTKLAAKLPQSSKIPSMDSKTGLKMELTLAWLNSFS